MKLFAKYVLNLKRRKLPFCFNKVSEKKKNIKREMKRQNTRRLRLKKKLERKGSSSIDKLDTQPMVTFSNASIDEGCYRQNTEK